MQQAQARVRDMMVNNTQFGSRLTQDEIAAARMTELEAMGWTRDDQGIWRKETPSGASVSYVDDTDRYADYWEKFDSASAGVTERRGGRAEWFGGAQVVNPEMAPVKDHDNMLFVFGTLMQESTRNLMLGRTYTLTPPVAALYGFQKTGMLMIAPAIDPADLDGKTIAEQAEVLLASPHFVPGQLLTGLSRLDMVNLDAYEGITAKGSGAYKREIVRIVIAPADAKRLGLAVIGLDEVEQTISASDINELTALETLCVVEVHAYTAAYNYKHTFLDEIDEWASDEAGGAGFFGSFDPAARTAPASTTNSRRGWPHLDEDWGDEVDDTSPGGWTRAVTLFDTDDDKPSAALKKAMEQMESGEDIDLDTLNPSEVAFLMEVLTAADDDDELGAAEPPAHPVEVIDLSGIDAALDEPAAEKPTTQRIKVRLPI